MEKKENIDELIPIGGGYYLTKEQLESLKIAEKEIEEGKGFGIEEGIKELRRRIEEKKAKNTINKRGATTKRRTSNTYDC